MNLDQAREVRAAHLQGRPVKAIDLQRALILIEESRPMPKGGRRYKVRLPALSPYCRERVNAVLLWKLGLALGLIEGRKAA